MEGKRMDEEDMKDSLLVKEGIMVKLPLVIFVNFLSPAVSALRFFPP